MSILKATPFHARTAEANRLNAWENRAGFTLASHYGDAAEEAVAARFGAILADVSWQWRIEISGTAAPSFVARLFTRDASALALGAAMDVLWLSDGGAVRGLGTVLRLAPERFVLKSALADLDWIAGAAALFGVRVEDRTALTGALVLAGPLAHKILAAAGLPGDLAPFSCRSLIWDGIELVLTRSGIGIEIICDADNSLALWDRLTSAGQAFALLAAGQTALDIVEIESGILRPGRDFLPACDGFAAAPLPQEFGLSALVDRAHIFNGRAGVLAAPAGPALCGVLFDTDGEVSPAPVLSGKTAIGRLLGSAVSPVLCQRIGFAVGPDPAAGEVLAVGSTPCRAVPLPFLPLPDCATENRPSAV